MTRREVLFATRFGERIAEEEGSELNAYFVETDPWRRGRCRLLLHLLHMLRLHGIL
jgi:hypothetical protein